MSRLSPVKVAGILLLDSLEVSLREAQVTQITVPQLLCPQRTSDFCIPSPPFEDLTTWLCEQLSYPEIESFAVDLTSPKKAGKSYKKTEEYYEPIPLFGSDEDEECVHGIRKRWCETCIEKAKQEKERRTRDRTLSIDPFDLIFPILYPPLGENLDSPLALPHSLYPFQVTGVKFLVEHDNALLGDEMGLGKSIQSIVALRCLLRTAKVTTCLILCPKSVLTDWERKLWEWAPELSVVKVTGPKDARRIRWGSPAHIHLTTYETLRQDLCSSLGEDNGEDIAPKVFDIAILDEIQKIKNPTSGVTKAARLLSTRFRWGLSGTPLENRVEDVISIFAYLRPGLLRYEDAQWPRKVSQVIKPYFLRRRKEEALPELPKKRYGEVWLDLSPIQREAYDIAEREGVVTLNEQGNRATVQHVLALITKLKQVCNVDLASGESCKLEYLSEKLEDVASEGEKALVFSQYPEKSLRFVEARLQDFHPLMYHGGLTESQREAVVGGFQEQESNKVLLMSVRAGGLGLTLTRANHVYHFDLWWNPAIARQAEDRAHRIGQKKTVFVSSLLTVGTIEERIQDVLRQKQTLFEDVIDGLSDTDLTSVLTEEELFGLFGLRKQKPTRHDVPSDSLQQISPLQFEELVANLYTRMGYLTRITAQTRDHGVDVYARRQTEAGTDTLAIQCKHYPGRVVGVEHARALYGVIHDQPSMTKGVLVTSGEFSSDCREFVSGKRIDLVDGAHLRGLLQKYDISIPK